MQVNKLENEYNQLNQFKLNEKTIDNLLVFNSDREKKMFMN